MPNHRSASPTSSANTDDPTVPGQRPLRRADTVRSSSPQVSVVVPTRNEARNLEIVLPEPAVSRWPPVTSSSC